MSSGEVGLHEVNKVACFGSEPQRQEKENEDDTAVAASEASLNSLEWREDYVLEKGSVQDIMEASFQLHGLLRVLEVLYYKVANSQLPAPQILRALKLHYKVASSQLPAPQIAPRTKVVLQSRQFSSSSSTDRCAYYSCTTNLPVLSLHLARILRVLKLYYKVASSQPPAPQILRVLKLHYKVASSHRPAPQILRVLKLYYKVASSQLPALQIAPRTKVVLESRQFSASSSTDCSAY